jgi:hypothetical protein
MSSESQTSPQPEVKEWSDVISRREALFKMAVASALALGLQPILALAKQPEEMLKQQAGRRVVVEIQNIELWKDSDATVLHTVLNVSADREYSISAYVVRDAPSLVILPGIVISRTSERTDVVALGGDDEYVHITDTSNLSDEEYIDRAIDEAEKRGRRKTVRYLRIIKAKYNKYKKRRS